MKSLPVTYMHTKNAWMTVEGWKTIVRFLARNTTALIQPLHQGFIRAIKAHYHQELLSALVNSNDEMEVYIKSVKLKGVMYSIGLPWESVSHTTIQHC
ncbi:hypothetical protein PR048_013862 [Dryococelus australis]|uniref:DDE-1 domain-containing protein n=1 Tax=Dryococelus australis TaxID=614101 RepID=A0ABQ9HTE0_9NEOP|nr:hypothetical protein PR048_013862 [Dryococelus australis]